jgi:hypothetical protein
VAFEDVIYWRELLQIFDWATCHVGSTLYVCWAAFAALNAFHGVPMRILPRKISGVFEQRVTDATHSLTAGMGATFPCPVSRHAEVAIHDVPWQRGLRCLAQSTQSGLCLIADERRRALYMFNHLEYDGDTLNFEYQRDRARRADLALPRNYWPNDNMSIAPPLVWRASAERLFANWLATLAARASAQLPVGPTQSAGSSPSKGPRHQRASRRSYASWAKAVRLLTIGKAQVSIRWVIRPCSQEGAAVRGKQTRPAHKAQGTSPDPTFVPPEKVNACHRLHCRVRQRTAKL